MSKKLFIAITVVLLGIFGVITYYGMQALEPHTYVPQEDAITENAATETGTPVTLPALPGLPPKTAPATAIVQNPATIPDTLKAGPAVPVKALSTEEQLAYIATSTIREINPDKLFFAPDDARAFPYGKNGVFVIERPSSLVPTSVWAADTATKTVRRIAGPALGLTARWSKNGRYVFTVSTDGAGNLTPSFIDTKLKTATPLRIATMPSKCFIADTAPLMYCGVPRHVPVTTAIPEDYLDGTFVPDDRIVKIDFKTPKVTELWDGASMPIDTENPAVIGNALFFTNRSDGSVWKLAL